MLSDVIAWVVLALYLVSLGARQRKITREIARLRESVDR
jgi:CcmD family protein